MAKRKASEPVDYAQQPGPTPLEANARASEVAARSGGAVRPASELLSPPAKDKPIHEVRIGRIKATIWLNRTESGVRHNVTLKRLFKRDANSQWETSEVFGRDDLLLVAEVCRAAALWIYEHGQG
jgi:hypothetical protein